MSSSEPGRRILAGGSAEGLAEGAGRTEGLAAGSAAAGVGGARPVAIAKNACCAEVRAASLRAGAGGAANGFGRMVVTGRGCGDYG
jgi:hypothetical protein